MRIAVAALFLQHGAQKLFGSPPGQNMNGLMLAAGILEFFGGLLVLVGLFTRPVAFILSGQMAVAYFMAHAPRGWSPLANHGELAVLYCFVFLYISVAGAGCWSIDSCLRRRQASIPTAESAAAPAKES